MLSVATISTVTKNNHREECIHSISWATMPPRGVRAGMKGRNHGRILNTSLLHLDHITLDHLHTQQAGPFYIN